MRNKRGLSIIELIICLAIMGILSLIFIPCFNALQSVHLEACSKELLYDIRLAQQKAIAEGSICQIYFDSGSNSYRADVNSSLYKNKKLPSCIKFYGAESSYENNKIAFNSFGNPVPRPCKVALVNELGQYRVIVIGVATQYIYLKDR